MKRRIALWRQLIHIGRSAGNRAEAGGIRFTALALAALLLPIGLAAPLAIDATEDGRQARGAAGYFNLASEATPQDRILLADQTFDLLEDSRQYPVYYFTPLGDDAPAPPGVDAPPEPGEVYLSPRLAALGTDEGIHHRYGEFAGIIEASALVDPTELIAYVGPSRPLSRPDGDSPILEIESFGAETAEFGDLHWVLLSQDFPFFGLHALALALLTAPAVLLAATASRVAAHARDRREALIKVLGGRPSHYAMVALGESWLPLTIGSVAAAAAVAVASVVNVPLPYVDFTLSAADMRRAWPLLFGCVLAAFTALMSASIFVGAAPLRGREPSRSRSIRGDKCFTALAWLFPVFVFVAAWGPRLFSYKSAMFNLVNYIGQIGVVLTLAPAVALLTAAIGRRLAASKRLRLHPAVLTAGARLAAHPKATSRRTAAVAAAFFLLFFALAYQSAFSSNAEEARSITEGWGSDIATVRAYGGFDEAGLEPYVAEISEAVWPVAGVADVDERGVTHLTLAGSCVNLERFGAHCEEGRSWEMDRRQLGDTLSRWLEWSYASADETITVTEQPLVEFMLAAERDRAPFLLVMSADGADLPFSTLAAAGSVFQTGVDVHAPGLGAQVGTSPPEEQARWVVLFGVVGLAVLGIAAIWGSAGEFLRQGRAMAPIGVLTGGLRMFRMSSAVAVFLPLLLGSITGIAVGIAASQNLMRPGTTLLRADLLVPTLLALAAVTVSMWWWASSVAIREAGRWRPGKET